MKRTCECGYDYNQEGICEECGLVDDEHVNLDDTPFYPYDDEHPIHYGDPRNVGVADISQMTRVNPRECRNPDLRRAIDKWDSANGWTIIKIEILKKFVKGICFKLGLSEDFLDEMYKLIKTVKDYDITGKALEDFAPALVYLALRLTNNEYTLYDFKQLGYDTHKIFRNYRDMIKELFLFKNIKPQDPINFILKFVNSFVPDDPKIYSNKLKLIYYVKYLFSAWLNAEYTNQADDVMALNGNSGLYAIGACLYAACKKDAVFKTTQKEIARVCGCSEVTLREYLKKLKKFAVS